MLGVMTQRDWRCYVVPNLLAKGQMQDITVGDDPTLSWTLRLVRRWILTSELILLQLLFYTIIACPSTFIHIILN